MIKFDKDEFFKPTIYSTNDEYKVRCKVKEEIVEDIKDLQQRIDKAIKELNQPWGLLDFEEAKKEYEHKKKIISILQGEEAK